MNTISHFLEEYGLISLEKQEKLLRLAGEHNRELDFEAGIAKFDELEFPFQILGTESDNTLTWLWAWADEQSEMPDHLLKACRQLKEWGLKTGTTEFTLPSIDLNRADGHMLSIISSALTDASCYYHDPYEGGALFLLLFGRELDSQPSFDIKGLTAQFAYLVSLAAVNPRAALLAYLRRKELSFTEEETMVTAELESGETLKAEFDKAGGLLSINGSEIAA